MPRPTPSPTFVDLVGVPAFREGIAVVDVTVVEDDAAAARDDVALVAENEVAVE